jgi:hypothetical protein
MEEMPEQITKEELRKLAGYGIRPPSSHQAKMMPEISER